MKKVFRKIQKGTTKMIERIKSLGEMETKQKCVVQRFEIIIPLHQKITTQYIASASFTCGFFSYRRLDKGFFATFFIISLYFLWLITMFCIALTDVYKRQVLSLHGGGHACAEQGSKGADSGNPL